MIVVTIQFWPGGRRTHARDIGRVFIHNASGDEAVCDYVVKAEESAGEHLNIAASYEEFVVKAHDRRQSVFKLLGKVFGHFSDKGKTIN